MGKEKRRKGDRYCWGQRVDGSEGIGKGSLWRGVFEHRAEEVSGPSEGQSECEGTEVTAQVGPRVSEGSWWQERGRGCVSR